MKATRVVIYQTKNLGDVFLSTSVNRALKAKNNDVQIVWVVSSSAVPIVEKLPNVKAVVTSGKSALGVLWQAFRIFLLVGRPDLFLDLHGAKRAELMALVLRPSAVSRVVGARSNQIFPAKRWIRSSFSNLKVPSNDDRPKIQQNLDCLRRIGLISDREDYKPELEGLVWKERHQFRCRMDLPNTYLLVHPGSRWMFKTLRAAQWISIVQYLHDIAGVPIVITGSTDEVELNLAKKIEQQSNSLGITVINRVGTTNLIELINMISMANFFVGVDSFAAHVASAASVSGVVYFGPTKDKVWGPIDRSTINLIASDRHSCRPCDRDGCGGSKVSDCLTSLTDDELLLPIEEALKGSHVENRYR